MTDRVSISVLGRLRYDANADILAFIAYPHDLAKRLKFSRAILNSQISFMQAFEPEWDPGIPLTRFQPKPFEDLDGPFRRGLKVIDTRLTAGKAVKPYIEEACAHRKRKNVLLRGKPVTKENIFTIIAEQPDELKVRSLATVWKASWPVIHLCVALTDLFDLSAGSHQHLGITELLNRSPRELLKRGNLYRALLVRWSLNGSKRGPNARPNFSDHHVQRVMWT